jgi:hypothetical protein
MIVLCLEELGSAQSRIRVPLAEGSHAMPHAQLTLQCGIPGISDCLEDMRNHFNDVPNATKISPSKTFGKPVNTVG